MVTSKGRFCPVLLRIGFAMCMIASLTGLSARQTDSAIAIDGDDIGGVVTSSKGPEAGVWVVAETSELPTKYIKIVVTDDRGRYVLPDLPKANYSVWVRGYGLVDSPKLQTAPGRRVNLTAVLAPSAKAAAEYYPSNYWFALLQPPPKSDFPGTGVKGNGIPEALKTQGAWLGSAKMTLSCVQCHQLGTKATREIPSAFKQLNPVDAWDQRVQSGNSGNFMNNQLNPLGRARALQVFADWTDRIAKGALPEQPPRPQGVERNVVVTQWEWSTPKHYVHDEIATDRRKPTINGYGPIYGVGELSGDWLDVLDPVKHTTRQIPIPPHDPNAPPAWNTSMAVPSAFWGDEILWAPKAAPHNPMFDGKGRVWVTARGGCRMYDPKTAQITLLRGCPGTHHLQIDDNEVLWFDAGGGAAYFDIKRWEQTGDDKAAGGVISYVLDINSNGKRDEPPVPANEPIDPTKDKALRPGGYSVIPNPLDGSIWMSVVGIPGQIIRVDPKTRLSEVYEPPYMNPRLDVEAYLPHGIDVDRSTGVIWTGLNSGHYAAFDRRKCKVLTGPTATGQHCPEGWTLHEVPGPRFTGVTHSGNADSFYLNWVDWHNTSGFGNNTPILTGSGSDSLIVFDDGKWVFLRVPYPLGFFNRGLDGRIDDPKAGWKGRGLWSTHGAQATWHQEGGKGQRPKVVQFQLRPNPLAK